MTERATTVRLQDYTPPSHRVLGIELRFQLHENATLVHARTQFQRDGAKRSLVLDGRSFVRERIAIDGRELAASEFATTATTLTLHAPPDDFTLEVTTRLDPASNTALEGLYLSGGRFCTQCEAEGFRTITYAQDRPDVMTRYTVRIEADRGTCPTLLSNGNPQDSGELPDGRHFAVWHDPHPKPTYLFALAAGQYESLHDTFVTRSGRRVELGIHVDPGEGSRAHYALDSLRRAMRWDEERYQREYDLDVFNLVAVRDFNFGAMENKGLNIFNSAYVLADPESATDLDYEGIEAVVGHEYFHNWTGNRITCRDWFQLSLKEGLTVFREHEFSADMRSRAVQRIKDVKRLRVRQFAEDAGPLAHPVRPQSYQAIDNFYTATVYEKGAEVIRMLQQALGYDVFAEGLQLYFAQRDGTASVVEDFVGCLAEAAGQDLSPFLRWYDQAGTPVLTVRGTHDAARGTYALTLAQRTPPTPGQPTKLPMPIPLCIGLLGAAGQPLAARLRGSQRAQKQFEYLLTTAAVTLHFEGIAEAPVPSVLRGFSAPVHVDCDLTMAQRLVQMAHDPDPFTRWDAGQALARSAMLEAGASQTTPPGPIAQLARALTHELDRANEDPAFAALQLRLPELSELMQLAAAPDPTRLFAVRREWKRGLAEALYERLVAIATAKRPAEFSLDARAAGERALRAQALDLLAELGPRTAPLLWQAFQDASSMTETISAIEALGQNGSEHFESALAVFYTRWRDRPLVLDKWFELQGAAPREDALPRVRRLLTHPDFDLRNPNRVRALVKSFAARNLAAFHARDGGGYEFLAQVATMADAQNPALASRLLQPLESWRRLDGERQRHVERILRQMLAEPRVSANCREMLERTLA
ncbi:MAG: aminopeptidase N [Planctomycetes bacterium]|jgi:aminopeptidase N|nr:aminopeptidase N [Planctomycetota bacterium]